jgi:ribosomal protein S18 acetylase RimI-like enzyme
MNVIEAREEHLTGIARLFDLYRQFYECDADYDLALAYLTERMKNGESTIFIAVEGDDIKGFTQLYPSFCSVDAMKIYILYDLYVDADVRNAGVGRLLMDRASEFARLQGANRVDLLTAHSNKPGQHLYEKLGYKKSLEGFYGYSLKL